MLFIYHAFILVKLSVGVVWGRAMDNNTTKTCNDLLLAKSYSRELDSSSN